MCYDTDYHASFFIQFFLLHVLMTEASYSTTMLTKSVKTQCFVPTCLLSHLYILAAHPIFRAVTTFSGTDYFTNCKSIA